MPGQKLNEAKAEISGKTIKVNQLAEAIDE